MANKSMKPCNKKGCHRLTRERYCESHSHVEHESKAEANKHYDRYHRDQKATSFYNSREWRRARGLAYSRDNGLCQRCIRDKTIKRADVVHHIIEIKSDWSKRLDIGNLESLCHACHNKIHG